MSDIGQGIAFASLVAGAVVLEINGLPSTGLWVIIVLWAIFATWNSKAGEDKP